MNFYSMFPNQCPFSLSPHENALPHHHNSSSSGSEQYPFGAPPAGDAFLSDGSSDSDTGSLAANDEPYLPSGSRAPPPGHPSPLEYTVAPDYLSGNSDHSASPGPNRTYSDHQNDNGYSRDYSSQYGQTSQTSNDTYDYTQDQPYAPPGFYPPPPLSAQTHRHFAYQRSQPPPPPPPQSIPHPPIAPQVQRDLPLSPSTSSSSSNDNYRGASYPLKARSPAPASPPPSRGQRDISEPMQVQMLDEQSHTGGSEPPVDDQEREHTQQWHETDRYLRNQIGIPEGVPVNLWALANPPTGQKPQQPLPILVKLAIHGCRKGMLTLQEIYQALEDRFEYFARLKSPAWKNSIRHNLSLNQVFRSCDRPITEPGKGRYWSLDISKGEGYKRERRRKRRNAAPYNGTRDLPGGIGNQIGQAGGESSDPDHEMDDDTGTGVVMGSGGGSSSGVGGGVGGGGKSNKSGKKGRKRGPYTRITVAQPSIPGSTGITTGGAAAAVSVGVQLTGSSPSPVAPTEVGSSSNIYDLPSVITQHPQPIAPPHIHHHHHHHQQQQQQQQPQQHHHRGVPPSVPAPLPYPISSYPPGMYFNRPPAPTFGQTSLPAPGLFADMVRTTTTQPPSQPRATHLSGSGVVGGSSMAVDMRRDATAPSVILISSDSGSNGSAVGGNLRMNG